MAKKQKTKSIGKRMGRLASDILASLREYGAYKRGEKTNIKVYSFSKASENVKSAHRKLNAEDVG